MYCNCSEQKRENNWVSTNMEDSKPMNSIHTRRSCPYVMDELALAAMLAPWPFWVLTHRIWIFVLLFLSSEVMLILQLVVYIKKQCYLLSEDQGPTDPSRLGRGSSANVWTWATSLCTQDHAPFEVACRSSSRHDHKTQILVKTLTGKTIADG